MKKQQRKWKRPQLKVYRELEAAKLPAKSRDTDHCFDFYAADSITIRPGETVVVPLGLRIELPKGYALVFKERSGLACKGIEVGAGVIDEEYRGPIGVVLRWMMPEDPMRVGGPDNRRYKINVGDKIVQGKLERTNQADVVEVSKENFNFHSSRGSAGFGSSGAR